MSRDFPLSKILTAGGGSDTQHETPFDLLFSSFADLLGNLSFKERGGRDE